MGNESNPSKAVQTIMTRSSLNGVPMSPDIKTNDKDPFQAIFFTILILNRNTGVFTEQILLVFDYIKS